jgi:acetylornithine/succinyldiaminopimelate/putrescine aminotransferase/predicted amino acid dehydrogenase
MTPAHQPTGAFAQHVNPDLARMLHGLGLDVSFVRGRGTELWDAAGRRYLDFAGAYGALPFGHDPQEIWRVLEEVRESGEPVLIQPSLPDAPGELARRLAALAPGHMRYAFLGNSGAEAVEAAIKIARAATGRARILSATGGFHGKTLGALSATARPAYQRPFGAPAPGFEAVPFGDAAALNADFERHGGATAAFLVEPVQGEGGVLPAPPGYLELARELCTRHGARLILDEVQTGLGRTGRLFGAEEAGIAPDIVTVAKALGGGLLAAGAAVYAENCASADFSFRHTSTFGGNTLAARVGLRVLDLLTDDGGRLVRQVAETGAHLRAGLEEVARRHPGIVRDVRGRGLLLGVELTADASAFGAQGLFRSLADAEGLAAHVCGHLLRRHGIRVAPAYFAACVIRVEPPLTVTARECDQLVGALDETIALIAAGDSRRFFAHLMPGSAPGAARASARRRPAPGPAHACEPASRAAARPRWAFLAHPTDLESYRCFDAALGLPGDQVRALFRRMNLARTPDTSPALLLGAARVQALDGSTSQGTVLALPYEARELLDLPTSRAVDLVRGAVLQAAAGGAGIVGLGAYTSIITANATLLRDLPVPVTTGNAYTAAAALDGLLCAAPRTDHARATCVVLGATGAIGRACAIALGQVVGRLVLAGNPRGGAGTLRRLGVVAQDVVEHVRASAGTGALAAAIAAAPPGSPAETAARLHADGVLTVTTDAGSVMPEAELIMAATSTPDAIIGPGSPRRGAVICDVSQPPNTDPGLIAARPDLTVVTGGLIALPAEAHLGLDLGVPAGLTWACLAETVLLAHRCGPPRGSVGDRLDAGLVQALRAEARRFGFRPRVERVAPPASERGSA